MLVAYDGGGFHGFARQAGAVRTVQGNLEAALTTVLRAPIETVGAGRTDAGVHAAGQVVSFEAGAGVDTEHLLRSLNGLLGPEIVVHNAEQAAADFDARRDALDRTYRYFVHNAESADPLLRHTSWHVADPLDLVAMNAGAGHVVGEHDFAAFCRAAGGRSTIRTVTAAAWSAAGEGLARFDITALAFCHQMVRSLVGLLVEVGRGRRPPGAVAQALAARDRSTAGPVAPPHGLVLWRVRYAS